MKSLLSVALLTLTFSTVALAENCTALLKRNGYTIDTFNAYGYNRTDACQNAKQDCERAMRNGNHYGSGMYCETPNSGYGNGGYGNGNGGYGNGGYGNGNGGYGNGGYGQYGQCTAVLESRYGQRIQYFYGYGSSYGNDACRDALRECNRFKTQYNYYDARCNTLR